jgi:pimeloyl-ACP methyl ester carboxylesterase
MSLREDMLKRVELAVGGAQLRTMERAIALAAGVREDRTPEGVVFATREHKRGLPIACIHGFGGDKETWLMMSALIPRSRGVALVDLPGHGNSADVPESACSIRHHAEAVLRVLDRAGYDRVLCVATRWAAASRSGSPPRGPIAWPGSSSSRRSAATCTTAPRRAGPTARTR